MSCGNKRPERARTAPCSQLSRCVQVRLEDNCIVCRDYYKWLEGVVDELGGSMLDEMAAHNQMAAISRHVGWQAMWDTHCLSLTRMLPTLVRADGALVCFPVLYIEPSSHLSCHVNAVNEHCN